MVVVVIATAAVPAELVKFANGKRINAAIVERVENRNTICRKRYGAAAKLRATRNRFIRKRGFERDLPCICARVILGQRHLLLPSGNSNHHGEVQRRVRKPVGFNIQPLRIPVRLHAGRE